MSEEEKRKTKFWIKMYIIPLVISLISLLINLEIL